MASFFDMVNPQQQQPPAGGSFPGGFNAILQPPPAEVIAAQQPPKNEAELQQRVQGWRALQQRIATDPDVQRALINFAEYMGRSPQPGVSGLGHLAGGINYGMRAYDLYKDQRRENAMTKEKMALETRDKESQIAQRQAATAQTQQQTQQGAAEFQEWMTNSASRAQELELRLSKAKNEVEKASIEAQLGQMKLQTQKQYEAWVAQHPEMRNAAFEAQLQQPIAEFEKTQAEIGASRALTGQRNAAADYYDRRPGTGSSASGPKGWSADKLANVQAFSKAVIADWKKIQKTKPDITLSEYMGTYMSPAPSPEIQGFVLDQAMGGQDSGVINLDELDAAPPPPKKPAPKKVESKPTKQPQAKPQPKATPAPTARPLTPEEMRRLTMPGSLFRLPGE